MQEEETVESLPTIERGEGNEPIGGLREAARLLAEARHAKPNAPVPDELPPVEIVEPPAAEPAPEAAAEQPTESTAETTEPAQPAIDPPKFWPKEEKERWASFPRETQEYLAQRESERNREIDRGQREAAETRKALEAERNQVVQARQQYESALPILLQNLQAGMAGEFADIKTMPDVMKMASEDPNRYLRWDAQQKQVAVLQQELQTASQRQAQEKQAKWSEFARKQDNLLTETLPEAKDPKRFEQLQKAAQKMLMDVGYTQNELVEMWESNPAFRDYRMQLALVDAVKYREAQAKAKAIPQQTKPVPPVIRPGASQPAGARVQEDIAALQNQLDRASNGVQGARIAAQLLKAQRAAAR